MLLGMPLLSLVIWLPIFFGVAVLVTGDRNPLPLAGWRSSARC